MKKAVLYNPETNKQKQFYENGSTLFGCGRPSCLAAKLPHCHPRTARQRAAINGGFAINPPSAEPLGGSTPSS